MKSSISIEKIYVILADLEETASILDNSNSKLKAHSLLQDSPMFSVNLFNTNSDLFTDYVIEIKSKTAQLSRLIKNKNEELSKYQIELIEKQISSLHNAFHSNKNIHDEAQNRLNAMASRRYKKAVKAVIQPSQNLYQNLSEHHEFERRLLQMLQDKEQERVQASSATFNKLSQDVLTLHQRLGRCRQAISKIEADIVKFESRN
ncbi:primosomal replication protein PriC [Pseudocolwellia sp. AS88]|jgi:primosomal replication protein N''|uniref:primosomal replication protein PriC n=1 Tax=Pseudocolwellia sp. AS88 TaxID=3063958 RepID=UPI0026ED8771|nr:primosomal replication protein PriC [Pseudocolwellia sp. AS88]MDO7086096.1 primosomal replication protein PriC [Pseudocolwellia sp. AS88]